MAWSAIRGRPAAWLGLAVMGLHAAALAYSAGRQGPMVDEMAHLAAGLSHWRFGSFELYRVNPPLARAVAALPLLLARDVREDWRASRSPEEVRREFVVGRDFVVANQPRVMACFTAARWACIPFSLIGAAVCWRWAHRGYGARAGILALVLWCSSPSVLTFGALLFPDLAAASMLLCAAYTFDRWLSEASWTRAVLAGAALGLALLAKTTLMICVPVWCLLLASCAWRRARPWRSVAQLLLLLTVAIALLNAGYLGGGAFERLDQFRFRSRTLAGQTRGAPSFVWGNRFQGSALCGLRVPLPREYVIGIDQQLLDFERGPLSYLRGRWQRGGWWYYYLYGLAVKEPASVLLLLVMSIVMRIQQRGVPGAALHERVPLLTMFAVLCLVSSGTGFSHHLRYVLPAQGLLYVWISRAAMRAGSGADRPTAVVTALAMAWSVLGVASTYPHTMSYFSELAGGPANGQRHMLFSSMDYGQDLLCLRDWADRHPQQPLDGMCCFGAIDPMIVGLNAGLPPTWPAPYGLRRNSALRSGPTAGRYAVSVHFLCGGGGTVWQQGRDELVSGNDYQYLASLEPIDRAGYSIWIFEVTAEDAARLSREPPRSARAR
jgi:hypothetical protein